MVSPKIHTHAQTGACTQYWSFIILTQTTITRWEASLTLLILMASCVPLGSQDLPFILYFLPELFGGLVLFQALGQEQTKHHPVKTISKHHVSTRMGVNSGGFEVGAGKGPSLHDIRKLQGQENADCFKEKNRDPTSLDKHSETFCSFRHLMNVVKSSGLILSENAKLHKSE